MDTIFTMPDLYPASAEIFLLIMACVLLVVDLTIGKTRRGAAYLIAQLSLIGCFAITWFTMDGRTVLTFSNSFIDDTFADVLKLVVYFSVAAVLVYSRQYMSERKLETTEFYLLVLFSTMGMMVLISASHFLTIYLGLEMMSLSLYAMVAINRDSTVATEAAMKYFVLGALASGLLLYGISMVYGATGTLELTGVRQALYTNTANSQVLVFGLVFIVAGVAFKLGVVPFHMWIPDVYQGAPTAITLFIGSASKLAAFAMAMRLLVMGLFELAEQWQLMLMFLAVLSISLGNLAAIAQSNIKRMLAYSAIAHMGFLLLALLSGVVAGDPRYAVPAYSSALFYAVTYVLMSLGAFGMILLLSRAGFEAENLEDFKGLNKRSPWFAFIMMILMFSLAGLPFFVGFFAKFAVLQAVVAAGYIWLAVFAVVLSLVGAYYYIRVVKLMYFDQPIDSTPIQAPADMRLLLSLNGLAVAALGAMPQLILEYCAYAFVGGR